MERTLALLAFDNPEESPFGDLLNMMQRQKVKIGERKVFLLTFNGYGEWDFQKNTVCVNLWCRMKDRSFLGMYGMIASILP